MAQAGVQLVRGRARCVLHGTMGLGDPRVFCKDWGTKEEKDLVMRGNGRLYGNKRGNETSFGVEACTV